MTIKKRKAFTLVELLVVISIISILTIVMVASFTSAQKKARDVKRKAELNSLAKALQMYYTDVGHFPVAANGDPNINDLMAGAGEFVANNYIYMKVVPGETKAGMPPYYYAVSPSGNGYNIFADLENRTDSDCNTASPYIRNTHSYCYAISSPNYRAGDIY